jgi:hypothetical protein
MLIDNVVLILGKIVVEEIIDHSSRVKWKLPLNAKYVHYIIASIVVTLTLGSQPRQGLARL